MALIALSVADSLTYVSDRDPCKIKQEVPIDPADPAKGTREEVIIEEGATKFHLKGLDVFLMGHIYDNASALTGRQGSDEVGIQTRVNKTNIEAVRHGLAGFENFCDAKGQPIKFSTKTIDVNGRDYKVASDDVLNALGIQLVQELAGEIKRISEVSAAEEKKSGA